MKRKIAAVLILLLLTLAGCEQLPVQTSVPTATTAPVQTTAPTETTAPQPTEYQFPEGEVVGIRISGLQGIQYSQLDDFIENATGLDIQWDFWVDSGITIHEPLPTVPTIRSARFDADHHERGVYGVYVNLWDYQDIMPNFFACFNSPKYADYKEAYMLSENELYAAPVFGDRDPGYYGWIYREDIFEALDLTVPRDWDSFYACLKALKAAYPESYPFTLCSKNGRIPDLTELAQQFGVDYNKEAPVLDRETGKFYDSGTTDAMRELLKKLDLLIEEGLMDAQCLSYDKAMWMEAFASGRSFITHGKATHIGDMEENGKWKIPELSLGWFNNIPLAESDLPYQTRQGEVQKRCWCVYRRTPNLELALRYLDWMYSDEAAEILSWGIEGESFGVDAAGEKYFLEDYDRSYQGQYESAGRIDMKAVTASYPEKTRQMIMGTMAAAAVGDFRSAPVLSFTGEDREVIQNDKPGWVDTRNAWLADFLSGKRDIHDDTQWQAYKDDIAAQHIEEIIAAHDSAYARWGEVNSE